MSYFLLHSDEDGVSIEELTEKELLKKITPDKDGDTYFGDGEKLTFLSTIPDSDKGYWMAPECSLLVIRGEIVIPKKVETITRYKL